jgi:hypothetical protein
MWKFIPKEAGVVNAPHKFHFVCKLSGCDGWVSTMVGKICTTISFGCIEEVAMFGGVVKGSNDGGHAVFTCICFDVDIY